MNGTPASPIPSSSAVTIPIPGKSILKHPPPPAPTLLSRFSLSRLLPEKQPTEVTEGNPLKRAHFILPRISTIYPISTSNPPSSRETKDEKTVVEKRETERRKRVVRMSSFSSSIGSISHGGSREDNKEDWWTMDKVESFYNECCLGVGEQPDPRISAAFKNARANPPRSLTLSAVSFTESSSRILSDLLSLEWGLRRLEIRDCDLIPMTLKPILHALLLEDSLAYLSLAGHPAMIVSGGSFRKGSVVSCMLLIGAYLRKSKSLTYLDLSCIPLDNKKSMEFLVQGFKKYDPDKRSPGLQTLKLDDCFLRGGGLEVLAKHVRTSTLQHLSLRHNKIPSSGCVALALMIRDYPDTVPTTSTSTFPTDISTPPPTPPPQTPSTPVGTTYTPYIPRSRRNAAAANSPQIVTATSRAGGITAISPYSASFRDQAQQNQQPSEALLSKVRALDNLPRLGCLKTLDLKGNDLRGGIQYLSQVLKRNRTLKTLNLAENKLDEKGLALIGDALKYNQSLETLDLSRNPCGGPLLDGIHSLRMSLSITRTLKRLFMTGTNIKAEGAISLAEFLPEAGSLLFLGLTQNDLGYAGVLALAESLKKNYVMRCLDLDVPPGDEGFAKMCRDILNSCVRNTEEAERLHHHNQYTHTAQFMSRSGSGSGGDTASLRSGLSVGSGPPTPNHEIVSKRGTAKGIWGMIEESELAKGVKLGEDMKDENDILVRARACTTQLQTLLSTPSPAPPPPLPLAPSSPGYHGQQQHPPAIPRQLHHQQSIADLTAKARTILSELQNAMISSTEEGSSKAHDQEEMMHEEEHIGALLDATDLLTNIIGRAQVKLDGVAAGGGGKPTLTLAGLGMRFNNFVASGGGSGNTSPSSSITSSTIGFGRVGGFGGRNGHVPSPLNLSSSSSAASSDTGDDDGPLGNHRIDEEDEDLLMTPRINKGKARAEPEVEEHERILSPIAGLPPEELVKGYFPGEDRSVEDPLVLLDETHAELLMQQEGEEDLSIDDVAGSPTHDRSRNWVEEEGEVFRKGNVLLSDAEMEGDYAGDELRRELLEAMVERPPPRPLDELADTTTSSLGPPNIPGATTLDDDFYSSSSTSPRSASPLPDHTLSPVSSPIQEKPPPKPYVSRTASISNHSILNVLSPTLPPQRSPLGSPIVENGNLLYDNNNTTDGNDKAGGTRSSPLAS